MLKKLSEKRWLIWLLVATLWSIGCIFLARWQYHRWEEKSASQNQVNRNYNAKPLPLGAVLTPSNSIKKQDEWKQVKASGQYVGQTWMVRNRPNDDGDFGYETVNVFKSGDTTIMVDRGWVGNGASAATPASVPAPPKGQVTLIGWARPAEKSLDRKNIPGQLSSISSTDLQRRTHLTLPAGYLRMKSETLANGQQAPKPEQLGKPAQAQAAGVNFSYFLQWSAGIIAAYLFVYLRARREYLDELADQQAGIESSQGAGTPEKVKKPKPKKTRIWDEEDE